MTVAWPTAAHRADAAGEAPTETGADRTLAM